MSYAKMDHAGWVQDNITSYRRAKRPSRKPPARTGWAMGPETLSPFQVRAFDLLGMTFGGIYNAPILWDKIEWRNAGSNGLIVPTYCKDAATFDFSLLTRFVFLCHSARIRGSIQTTGQGMDIALHQRQAEGSMSVRHPNLDEAVADHKAWVGKNHRILAP